MMPLVMHGKVAPLSGLVRALGTLESRRLAAALDHLVSPHGALPSVALAAEAAAELALLLVRHAAHVDDADFCLGPGQDLERIREDARRAAAVARAARAGARARLRPAARRRRGRWLFVVRAQDREERSHTCNSPRANQGGTR